ncbi:phospholipase C, phosphocholine-specific [Variovorax paradoxus]|uniref:phosphocholine-specific phospholipase C n=1 Tax=Variovorax paradoxus TaxID=34073 RepID=UPI00041BAA2F
MQSQDRRKFLRSATYTLGAAAALNAFPPSIRRALAIPAAVQSGTIQDVKHVVILMMENRSFDHYFGTMRGVRGFGERITIPLASGKSVMFQSDGTKDITPFHLDPATMNAMRFGDTPHEYSDSQLAWRQGMMDHWPQDKKTSKRPNSWATMGYFTRADIPFQYQLADAFTLCDGYHCSVSGPTISNRTTLFSGSSFNPDLAQRGINCTSSDSEPRNLRGWVDHPAPGSSQDDPSLPGYPFYQFNTNPAYPPYKWPTIPEVLQKAGVSWRICQDPLDNFDGAMHGGLPFQSFREAQDNHDSPLFKNGMNKWTVADMKKDVIANKLPEVVWVLPPELASEHPDSSSPVHGGYFIQQVLDALTANPDVWSKTALILNFDEGDGYFDHAPPPAVPSYNLDGTLAGKATLSLDGEYYDATVNRQFLDDADTFSGSVRPFGPGPRVPMTVISPWSKGGWVNSQFFDHCSVGMFLEKRFGITIAAISPWHRAVCGDLTSVFNFATPNDPQLPKLQDNSNFAAVEADQLTKPFPPEPATMQVPVQEPGTRPSRALPYELHASARIDAAGGTVNLLFSNTGRQGAVFHVYDKLHLDRIPRRYTVEAGKDLSDTWHISGDAGKYDLWIMSQNGYLRHLTGDTRKSGPAQPECQVCYDVANGDVIVHMRNTGTAACSVTVKANAYRTDGPWVLNLPAGGATIEQAWSLDGSGSWYDFSVTRSDDPSYLRRFAGRVETGRDSVSDPAMGAAT